MQKRRYEKKARAEGEARTRQKILDAAVACLSGSPADSITVDELARRAEVSVQTLLRIHGSKEAIYLLAARSIAADLVAERDAVEPGDLDGARGLLLQHYERWGEAHQRLVIWSGRFQEVGALLEELRLRHRSWVRRIFARELEKLPPARRPRQLAALAVALDVDVYRRLRREGLSPGAAAEAVERFVRSALQPEVATAKSR